jgi:dTMP kinase
MRLRPFSSQERGMFISIDGPSGAGKSTIVRHLAQMLVSVGESVHILTKICVCRLLDVY